MVFGNLSEYGRSNECEISPILLFLRGKKFYTNFCIEGKTNNILKKRKKKKEKRKKEEERRIKQCFIKMGIGESFFKIFFIIVCNNHIL